MVIIKTMTLDGYAAQFPLAKSNLEHYKQVLRSATWQTFNNMRETIPHADQVKLPSGRTVYVINICGNDYRLIIAIHFNTQRIFIRDFMTHAEYSKENWKNNH